MLRRALPYLIPLVVAWAILVPAIQAFGGLGLSAQAFSSQGDQTLRAAGYAFSIWSVIYLGMIGYASWQFRPAARNLEWLAGLRGPSALAIFGCGAWIIASAANARWASVLIIVVSAALLILGLSRARAAAPLSRWQDRLLVWWPMGLLAGWLTIASALNILTVLTAEGLIPAGAAVPAALAGVAVVAILAAAVSWRLQLLSYAVPIAWGLVAVWVAERAGKPDVALAALGAAVAAALAAAWLSRSSAVRR